MKVKNKAQTFEEKVDKLMNGLNEAEKSMMNATEHLGPFHSDPHMDKLYRFFRMYGYSPEQSKENIYKLKSSNS